MNRILVSLAALSAFALPAALVACSSSSSGNNPSDAGGGGPDTSTTSDGAMPGTDGGTPMMDGGGGLPEGSTAPTGTQIVQAASVTLEGVTSDGYAIYTDNTAQTLNAAPIAGGSPIGLGMTATDVLTSGKVALVWVGASNTTGAGTLSVWTQANGMPKQVSTAALDAILFRTGVGGGLVDVSSDGSKVLFFDNGTASTADLTVVNADGTGKMALVTGVHLDNQECPPFATFVGSAVVASYCTTAGPDAGVAADAGAQPVATLTAYTGTGWTATTISSAAKPGFFSDAKGTQLVYQDMSGAWLWAIGMSGKGTQVPGLTQGGFTSDGSKLVFVNTSGAMQTAAVATPTGTTTLASGFANVLAISPDNNWVLADKMPAQGGFDLYLASTTAAGTPATLSSTPGATFYGDPYTADSKYAVWITNQSASSGTGDLYASATTNGTPAKLGTGVWINNSATGSKVVFNVNCNGCSGNGAGTADLQAVDVSGTAAPKVLASQADGFFYLSGDKTKIVYGWNYLMGSMTGIWVVPVP
jgi:hypothetical protein